MNHKKEKMVGQLVGAEITRLRVGVSRSIRCAPGPDPHRRRARNLQSEGARCTPGSRVPASR